jgi:hypothetical protein
MKRIALSFCIIMLASLLGSCGPSAEQMATMTAAAWTSTPPPTPVPPSATPAPYDLDVTVMDDSGTTIAGASLILLGSGSGNPVLTNEQGVYSWSDLPTSDIKINVTGQGYQPGQQTATLARGPNQVKVVLKRDPAGILPSEACATGQKVLYIEDFQDGLAQDWPEISAGIKGDMPNGWSIVDDNGNKILRHADAPSPTNPELQNHSFDNFVWKAKFKVVGSDAEMFYMWRITHPDDQSRKRYAVVFSAKQKPWMIRFIDQASGPLAMNAASGGGMMKSDQWYDLALAYFNGNHQVWYDGKKQLEYKDSQPFPAGTIGFETHLDADKTTQFLMDNLVMCELTAAYEPPQ